MGSMYQVQHWLPDFSPLSSATNRWPGKQQGFGALVHLGDRVDHPFIFHLDIRAVAGAGRKAGADDFTGLARQLLKVR